ncbi:hypothetical protein TcCL_NonESM12271 [Trypanosoma cruzi]|nr:hypothetical protein TcCL_NonESM12271 [Trypanosoma cruzi]
MEEQCTGNTQRRSPPAAGVTAGASLFLTRQQTLNNVHTKNTTNGMQKSTAAHQSTHALPPVVLLLSSPTLLHITPHAGKSPVNGYTAAETHRQVQLLDANQSAIAPGTRNATPLTDCTPPTSRPQNVDEANRELKLFSQKQPQPESCA